MGAGWDRRYIELCHIAKVGPTLDDVVYEPGGWLDRLLSIGVLRLESTRPVRVAVETADAPDIVEQQTKQHPRACRRTTAGQRKPPACRPDSGLCTPEHRSS